MSPETRDEAARPREELRARTHIRAEREAVKENTRRTMAWLGFAAGVWGLYILWLAYTKEEYEFIDGGRVVLTAFGFFVISLAFNSLQFGFSLGERVRRAAQHTVLLALAGLLTAIAFALSLDLLGGMSIGPLNGGDLVRLASVAFDFYVVSALVLAILRDATGTPEAERYVFARVAAAIVLALAAQFLGALDPLYRLVGATPPGPPVTIGVLKVERMRSSDPAVPLEAFAGTWASTYAYTPRDPRGDWTARVEVRVSDGKASARVWRTCSQGLCDAGVFQGKFASRHKGRAQALYFVGNTAGLDWIVSLRPVGGGLSMGERHAVAATGTRTGDGASSTRREK